MSDDDRRKTPAESEDTHSPTDLSARLELRLAHAPTPDEPQEVNFNDRTALKASGALILDHEALRRWTPLRFAVAHALAAWCLVVADRRRSEPLSHWSFSRLQDELELEPDDVIELRCRVGAPITIRLPRVPQVAHRIFEIFDPLGQSPKSVPDSGLRGLGDLANRHLPSLEELRPGFMETLRQVWTDKLRRDCRVRVREHMLDEHRELTQGQLEGACVSNLGASRLKLADGAEVFDVEVKDAGADEPLSDELAALKDQLAKLFPAVECGDGTPADSPEALDTRGKRQAIRSWVRSNREIVSSFLTRKAAISHIEKLFSDIGRDTIGDSLKEEGHRWRRGRPSKSPG